MSAKSTPSSFWAKVKIGDANSCWEWQASRNQLGYGGLSYQGRRSMATHIALELSGKPRPNGAIACHHCDNPPCVNPAHLYWGTNKQNSDDKIRRGRFVPATGESVGTHKLTEENVREILSSTDTQKNMAHKFGITQGLVSKIRRREAWKHIREKAARSGHARGQDAGPSKITPHTVLEIRKRSGSQQSIADEFGISQSLVSAIKRRTIWAHLD